MPKSPPQGPKGLVFWDGYGLDNRYSGVFAHAKRLATELVAGGLVCPRIVGPRATCENFRELDCLVLETAGPFRKVLNAKPIWPLRVGKAIAQANLGKPHVIHGLSNFNVPYLKKRVGERRVLTVHDLIPLLAPESVSPLLALQIKFLTGKAVAAADKIVCISEWTHKTLTDRYAAARDKCVVIPNGAGPLRNFGPKGSARDGKIRLLTVGRFESYKRLDWAVRILRELPANFEGTMVTNAKGTSWCRREAADLLGQGRLTLRTDLGPAELENEYAAADVLVHPSRYEGFCLPAVEALSHGLSVVYQSGSAMDEILKPSVAVSLSVDATLDQWVQGVENARQKVQESAWQDTVAKHHASLPTWKDAAGALASLYSEFF